MESKPNHPNRRSLRLPAYDYSLPGAYFVTLVVHHRQPLFGQIRDGEGILNAFGELVAHAWRALPSAFSHCELDEWVVMPDHFHAILWLHEDSLTGEAAGREVDFQSQDAVPAASPLHPSGPVSGSLGEIIQRFKSITSRRINALRRTPAEHVWQRNYFERIIRNERELDQARNYIRNNPLHWQMDQLKDKEWWDSVG